MSRSDLPQTPVDAPWWPLVGERYVSRRELAGILGVSVATVDRMVAEGMPSVTWGRAYAAFQGLAGDLLGVGA